MYVERGTRIELVTFCLEGRHSTAELTPHAHSLAQPFSAVTQNLFAQERK